MRSGRRLGAALVVLAQLALIVRAYSAPIDTFGFQMFPEASDWQAYIYRVTDGGRVSIREPWPGGYEWNDLVEVGLVGNPGVRHPAAYGVEATLFLLQHALDWFAAHTPEDRETRYLVAEVSLWPNGRGPEAFILHSEIRGLP